MLCASNPLSGVGSFPIWMLLGQCEVRGNALYTEFKGRRAPKPVTEIELILMQYFLKSILIPSKSMMNKIIKILKEYLSTCWPCKINITKPQVFDAPNEKGIQSVFCTEAKRIKSENEFEAPDTQEAPWTYQFSWWLRW